MLKTADYLLTAIQNTQRRPYTVAIASYALVLMKQPQRYNPQPVLMKAAAPGKPQGVLLLPPPGQTGLFKGALLGMIKASHRFLTIRSYPLARQPERLVHTGGDRVRPAGAGQTGTNGGG